jgi:hypothetical protein
MSAAATDTLHAAIAPPPSRRFAHRNSHAVLCGLVALMGILDAIWLTYSPLHLDLAFLWKLGPIIFCLSLLWSFYTFIRHVPRLSVLVLAAMELLVFSYCGGILSYLLMTIGRPWQDALFASWDRLLGFDWLAYTAFIGRHPWMLLMLDCLYQSTIMQIICVMVVLGFTRRSGELVELIGTVIVGGMATIVIGAFLPALGGYAYFNLPHHEQLPYLAATAAAHDGTLTVLDPRHLEGLVAFPSYHTYLSVALISSNWRIRYLRYPMLILNLLLLIGVPVFGGHYLVDMIAGGLMAVLIRWIWRFLMHRLNSRELLPTTQPLRTIPW